MPHDIKELVHDLLVPSTLALKVILTLHFGHLVHESKYVLSRAYFPLSEVMGHLGQKIFYLAHKGFESDLAT